MAYDWSEIGLTTVRDVTDSYLSNRKRFPCLHSLI